MQTKIASFQSDAQSKNFTLQYNDEENERITFSSNEELRAAIALNKEGNTLKVFVTINQSVSVLQSQQQTEDDTATNKELHVGVTCDGCNGPVVGIRHKCFVCPNYDLCEKCLAKGIHSEHNMIKITKTGHPQHPHGYHHHQHPHGHHPEHPHGHQHQHDFHHQRHQHFHNRHHRRHHRHTPPPPFTPGPGFLEQIQAQIPQWLPNREHAEQIPGHVQQHFEALKANGQTHLQNSKQYLESVGQYVQRILSPFGIDCDYHVDEKDPTSTTTTSSKTTTTTTTSTTDGNQEEQVTTTTTTEENNDEQVPNLDAAPEHELDAVPKDEDLLQIEQHESAAASSAASPIPDEPQKISDPIEKLVDDCIERMTAMGFIDANGALRELIRSKHGDINAVLDAINPRNFQ